MRPYFRQVAGLLVIGSLAGIAMNIAVVLPSVLLGHAVDAVLAFHRGQATGGAVAGAALLLIVGTAATELPRVGKRWWLGVARARIYANVRADALRGVLSWPAERLHTTSVGEVMARIIGDVEVLGTGVNELIVETWDTVLFSVALIVAMLAYDPTLGALALAPVPIALTLAKVAGIWVSRRTLRAREANAALTTFVQEGLVGLRVLRASGRRAAFARRLNVLADAQADAELAATRLDSALAPVYGTLTTAGILAVIWLGGTKVATGALSVGDLVAFLGLFTRFTARAFRIPQMANRVQAATAAFTRLAPLLAPAPPLDDEPARASWRSDRVAGLGVRPRHEAVTPQPGPVGIALDDVLFVYPGAAHPALNEVSLTVAPGSLVAVTGPVGSGKTALARAVLGLYPVPSGRVRIDGADPHTWTPADRDSVGYLPQGNPVFSGSVADNIALTHPEPGTTADTILSGRLAKALRVADLDTDVAGMADGMATGIGELGVRVSGGQRQRIALARALAAPATGPRLLVLDDPFSAIDADTESRIIAALREAVGPAAPPECQATILLCSTRLAAFAQADEVIVLDQGRIHERGKHQELLAAGGLYARIFCAQRHGRTTAAVVRP
ncbi:ABC transporter ATP-binding protein [Actinacidiphila soli]|uniref:ABC transporter ATP-binding protein n=1 Tax=Actinacidiphila soli TaxID=2487275 RepID=UPI000FCB2FE9|nr:ABC transporter ATP-binding protein [Actinacidiphila soli]